MSDRRGSLRSSVCETSQFLCLPILHPLISSQREVRTGRRGGGGRMSSEISPVPSLPWSCCVWRTPLLEVRRGLWSRIEEGLGCSTPMPPSTGFDPRWLQCLCVGFFEYTAANPTCSRDFRSVSHWRSQGLHPRVRSPADPGPTP